MSDNQGSNWRKLAREAIHLHHYVEAFCAGQVEFLCNAPTEALCVLSDAPVGTVDCSSLEIGKCPTLRWNTPLGR